MVRLAKTGAAETAHGRFSSLEKALKRSNMIVLALAGVTSISVLVSTFMFLNQPAPSYFATDSEGRITPLIPVSEPMLTDNQVTNFAVDAVTRSMTFTFNSWRDDFSEAREFFQKPDGWDEFVQAVEASQVIEYVTNRRMNATAVANGAVILSEGLDAQGRYTWIIQIPLVITYESSTERSRDPILAEVSVSRLPTWETSRGVGVTRITMRPGGAQ